MRFSFTGLKRALEFREAVRGHGYTAELELMSSGAGWHIVTDSRCLTHAAELYKFIYGGRA
jgi:hypothetical protein